MENLTRLHNLYMDSIMPGVKGSEIKKKEIMMLMILFEISNAKITGEK